TLGANVTAIEDILLTDGASYALTVNGATGIDSIDGSGLTGSNALTLDVSAYGSNLEIFAGAGNDAVTVSSSAASYVALGEGSDTITANFTNFFVASSFEDTGITGTDQVIFTGGGSATIAGSVM